MKLERSVVVNALIVAAAIGSSGALLATLHKPTSAEATARANNLLPHFPRDSLRRIQIKSASGTFTLARSASSDGKTPAFELAAEHSPTDPEAMESLLRALELGGYLRRFDGAANPEFGFGAPRLELELDFGAGRALLRVGKVAVTPANASYVQVQDDSGEHVGLVREDWVQSLPASADALRPRALLPFALSDIEAVRVKDGATAFDVTRGPGPSWLSGAQRVRRDAIEHLIFELGAVKAESFLAAADARARLDRDGALSATLGLNGGRPALELRVGSSCPSDASKPILLRTTPALLSACAPAGLRELFATTQTTLPDHAPFALHADEVESVRIERGGEKLEFARTERGFQLRAPSVGDLALDLGNQRLSSLLALEGEPIENPNLAELGLALPEGSVKLKSSAIERAPKFEETLELGRARADGRLPVRRAADGVVLLISRDGARELSPSALLLRPPEVLDFNPSSLLELDVDWPGAHERLRRNPDGSYQLLEPAGYEHDGALTLELVQALGTLKAERWVADRDEPAFGFSAPRAKAVLTLLAGDAGARHVGLSIGAETVGGYFAKLDDQPGVFVIARGVVSQLTTLLLSRSLISFDSRALERLELESGSAHLSLVRRGDELVPTSGEVPPGVVPRVLETLENLRAEAAVQLGNEKSEPSTLLVRLTPRNGRGAAQTLRIGRSGTWHDLSVYFARVDGREVTYALPEHSVRELKDAL